MNRGRDGEEEKASYSIFNNEKLVDIPTFKRPPTPFAYTGRGFLFFPMPTPGVHVDGACDARRPELLVRVELLKFRRDRSI
jgi:hypothetical protein